MSNVIEEIAAERRRQIEVEGWTAEHDDGHKDGEMARAAAAYALHSAGFRDQIGKNYTVRPAHPTWPWDRKWWKPKNPRRDLVRAAALIVAEIERLDRATEERCSPEQPCCERANEYNGFGSDGPTIFTCPKSCPCHD